MNEFYYPQTFYSIVNPLFYFSKIFGLAPFSLTSTVYKKSKINLTWSVILLGIYVIIFICFIEKQNASAGFITTLTAEVDAYCNQFGMWCAIILAIYFANELSSANINKIDYELQQIFKMNLREEYRRNYTVILIAGTIVFIYLIFYSITALFVDTTVNIKRPKAIAEFIMYVCPFLTNTVVALQFCSITWCLKRRFMLLNSAVENICNKINLNATIIFSEIKIPSSDSIQNRLFNVFENVREKHIELCNVCVKLNKCFSFQILLMVLQNFISIILAMYFGGKSILANYRYSVAFVTYCFNQMFLAIMQLVLLVLICSSTVAQAHRTGDLIHNSLSYFEPCKKEMFLQASYFSLQLLHNNFNFTASGVITIDPGLLLQVIGAICTYLVIVVQFEISYPTKNC